MPLTGPPHFTEKETEVLRGERNSLPKVMQLISSFALTQSKPSGFQSHNLSFLPAAVLVRKDRRRERKGWREEARKEERRERERKGKKMEELSKNIALILLLIYRV